MAQNTLPKKYGRDKNNGEILVPCEEFANLLTTKINGLGYNHLTTWSTLCKMLEPVAVPDDKIKHRMLHLGAAVNMNDENDKHCGKRVFFTSFSFGPTENISMWTNYGIPNEEAIRIKFTDASMMRWVNDFKAGDIKVYGVGDDYSLIPLQAKADVKLVQVAYWSKTELGKRQHDPNDGLFFYDNEKYRLKDCPDVNAWMAKRPYLFKEYGWNYEKEVRLVIVFDKDVADQYKRVAVPFDKPFQNLIKYFKNHVTQGPWYNDEKSPATLAAGHSLSEATSSRYKGLVKMRSVCDGCKQEDKKKCNCPFQGQR